MLTRRDFRYNSFILRILSTLRILPVDIGGDKGILKVPRSLWKRCISLGFFGLSIIHACYVHFRLFQLLVNPQRVVRHHLVFHAEVSFAAFITQGWYLSCFILHPETFVALFNGAFAASKHASASRWAYSRQELLALAMPMLIAPTIVFVLCVYTFDRNMAFLLYSSLSRDYKTPFWFRLLFVEEIIFLAVVASNASIMLNAQLLFFEDVTNSLKLLKSSRVSSTSMSAEEMAEWAYSQLRKIQLQVSLFNNMNRFITFTFKLYCIAMCTFNGYYMIAYFSADPIFGCLYYAVFVLMCTLYSIMYEKAFAVPKMVRLAKSAVLLRAGTAVNARELKRKMEMRLRSVPAVGIEIGHFHTFERVATPVFLDYVLRNVAGLLVMHLNS